jgi:hypothetical protein
MAGRPPECPPELAERIFDLSAQGHSARAIAAFLNAEGIKTRRGNKFFHATITAILASGYGRKLAARKAAGLR